ncbi:MAG: bacteriohemerythrin [Rhodocyclaceae bacterium]|nr:bacteriohemerythrin [Rhodocyclaceae bacterium]
MTAQTGTTRDSGEAFSWNAAFETGFGLVDEQHRHLIRMINQAAPLLASSEPVSSERVESLLDALIDYAVRHFADEETLMSGHDLDPDYVALHCRQHREFAGEVQSMRAATANRQIDTVSLLKFLTSWLTFHILGTDQMMAAQIRALEQGVSPHQAYLDSCERRDGNAVAPLLEALTNLYQIISRRNEALVQTNRSLEAKVSERTAELAREKSELADAIRKMELTQSQLLQSEKMASIGQLAAGVAHEINNPVGYVNSNLGTLRTYVERLLALNDLYGELEARLPASDPLRAQLADAKQRADLDFLRGDIVDLLRESQDGLGRIKGIVADLKDFAHVGEVEWQDADINAGLDSTLNVVWNELKYKAEVVRDYGQLPNVRCLAAQLNQVFMNLLVNAAQAIEERGTITVRTRDEGERVRIEIADTGKGMSEAVQKRIFEPFFTTKPVGKGTGLGLSIAWDIVRKHAGEIDVASQPGEGTCFTIRVPILHPHCDD